MNEQNSRAFEQWLQDCAVVEDALPRIWGYLVSMLGTESVLAAEVLRGTVELKDTLACARMARPSK